MAPGWVQQGVQVPASFREQFRREADDRGHSSVKTLGTIGMGILLGMPPEVRTGMYIWAQQRIGRSGGDITAGEIYRAFRDLMEMGEAAGDEERMARLLARVLRGESSIPPTESGGKHQR